MKHGIERGEEEGCFEESMHDSRLRREKDQNVSDSGPMCRGEDRSGR